MDLKCVYLFSVQHLSETFPILRGIKRDMVKNACWSSCTLLLIVQCYLLLSHFNET